MNKLYQVLLIANNNIAKSRYYKYNFINVSTGIYSTANKAAELISLEAEIKNIVFDSPKEKVETIMQALHMVDFISKLQSEGLNGNLPKWSFFDDYFNENRCGVKLPILPLYSAFCEAILYVNHKQFYSEFNSWVKENQYNVNFVNRLALRKVILVK